MVNGYLAFSVPYIYFEPDFYCKSGDSDYLCSETEACINPEGFRVKVIRTSIVSVHQLYCDRNKYKSIAISLMNLFGGFLSLIFTILADHKGRLIMLQSFMVIWLLSFIVLACVTNFYVNTLLNIVIWLSSNTLLPLTYVYFSEISSDRLRHKSNIIIVMSYALGSILCHVINIKITDFRVIYIVPLGVIIVNLPFFFFLKKSPYFLFHKNRLSDFQKNIKLIWTVNQTKPISISEQTQFDQMLQVETEKLIQCESGNQVFPK